MEVRVRLVGVFRGLTGQDRVQLKLEHPTVRDVVQAVAGSFSIEARRLLIDLELSDPRPNSLILLNGQEINALNGLQTAVNDGDEVTLIPVAHGG